MKLDVVFTPAYAGDPATATVSVAVYTDIKVEKVDSHTVRVTFARPTPFWAEPFVGSFGMILPKHVCEQHFGLKHVEINEYTEIAGLCRHGQHWYRLCIRTDQHPHRTWCHVIVDENEKITGLRLEPS